MDIKYSFIRIMILRMNIILNSYARYTGTKVKIFLKKKNTIGTILLCINLYSSSGQTTLEIDVT